MKHFTAADFRTAMRGPDPRRAELAFLQSVIGPADDLLAQSQPPSGTVLTERGVMDVAEAMVAFDVGTVIHRFGTWVVTGDGIACLVRHYPLTEKRLHEHEDWAALLAEQPWVNLWDFLRALAVAQHLRRRHPEHGPSGDGAYPA